VLADGEWWRLVTALTLHADSAHLLGNVFFGGLLAYVLCRHLGSGLAWFSILLASVAANGINVLLRDNFYQSVGFSTAVFSMVGMLSGLRLCRVGRWRETVLALGSAAALLALLGTSGENTDLGAHFWGVGSGFLAGLALAHAGLSWGKTLSLSGQRLLLLAVVGTVIAAWWRALMGQGV
jgi:membrane associated rhomboid family serine protease